MKDKKNIWYWLGNAAVGLLGIGVAFSDQIINVSFPEKTLVHQLSIPISFGLKFVWDLWRHKQGKLPDSAAKMYDKILLKK